MYVNVIDPITMTQVNNASNFQNMLGRAGNIKRF